VPTRISAPAAARDFAIAQPYPLSSATPAINALFPAEGSFPCYLKGTGIGTRNRNNIFKTNEKNSENQFHADTFNLH